MKRPMFFFVTLLCLTIVLPAQTRGISAKKLEAPEAAAEAEIILEKGLICNVYSLAYSPDGKLIAAGYNNNLIRIWDAKTGSLQKTLSGHNGVVWSVAFSPDGKTLISGSADKTIKCWNVQSGKEIRTLKGHNDTVSFVTYSTDGVYFASGSADHTINIWDASNGRLLQTLKGHSKTIASIAYSKDGKYMASGSWDKTAKVYYAVGGAELMTYQGHTDAVYAVCFSPDGKYLASGSADRTIKICDVSTGDTYRTLTGSNDAVWYISYSPDGKNIAGSSADGGVRVWDVESGKVIFNLKGHKSPVRSVTYSADGLYLSSGDSDGMIKLWNASTGTCLATMLQGNNGEWVTWTPEGFLNGSEWALKNLSYTVNGKEYSLDRVYDKLYRPDLVSAKIIGDAEHVAKAAERNSLSVILRGGDMPDVSFAINRTPESDRDIIISMKITNVGGGIGRVLLKLNERAFLIADSVPCQVGETVSLVHTITLRKGENAVSVTAYDATGSQESAKSTQKISWDGTTKKPRLFILAVAVNEYADKNISKLKNCVADANGVIDTFTQYSGNVYTDVVVQKLYEREVTKDNLAKAIASIGKEASPDDVFILYLAGHGKTYVDGDYYYIPCDFRYENEESIPKFGVSKWELIKNISSIQASSITVLLDTCNSGSFAFETKERHRDYLEAMDKEAIIERFAAKAGYDMLAACSTYQYAMDDYNGHGIFSYHVMEALQGYADLNGDGNVSSTELSYYVISEVPRNSVAKWGYEQDPQRILVNPDFTVVGSKNPKAPRSLKDLQTAEVKVVEKKPESPKPQENEQPEKASPAKSLLQRASMLASADRSLFSISGYGFVEAALGSYSDMASSVIGCGVSVERRMVTQPDYSFVFYGQFDSVNPSDGLVSSYQNIAFLGGVSRRFPLTDEIRFQPDITCGLWIHSIALSKNPKANNSLSDDRTNFVDPAFQASLSLRGEFNSINIMVSPMLTLLPEQTTMLSLAGIRAGIVWPLK